MKVHLASATTPSPAVMRPNGQRSHTMAPAVAAKRPFGQREHVDAPLVLLK
jgi:hypothetical protein